MRPATALTTSSVCSAFRQALASLSGDLFNRSRLSSLRHGAVWPLVIYVVIEDQDRVVVVSIQDSRSAPAPGSPISR